MKTILWLSIIIIVYTFIGYAFILYLMVKIRQMVKGKRSIPEINNALLPSCTLVIAAYNEAKIINEKIKNTLNLNYPRGKLKIIFVTDGSDDGTQDIISGYPDLIVMHQPLRSGKIAAVHRAVQQIDTEVIVFTDANTLLNRDALLYICRHYTNRLTGAVAGEKRISMPEKADASSAGEGFYWKYESTLKKWDSELFSVVGAAGELFSIRKNLYCPVAKDTVLDDFMISMLIAQQGYRIVYEPDAYAIETASEDVSEELKRKVRIAAGGIQSIIRLYPLLNILKYHLLSFQYISHRVLRWTITPFLLILVFFINAYLAIITRTPVYLTMFTAQVTFYLLALTGFILEKKQLRLKIFFVPCYFCIMNYAVLAGIFRYFRRQQSAMWEKAKRK